MGVPIEIALPGQVQADAIAVPVAEPLEPLGGEGARILDERLGGRLSRLAGSGDLRGRLGKAALLHVEGELGAPRLLVAGVGPREQVDADALRTAAAAAVAELSTSGSLLWLLDDT